MLLVKKDLGVQSFISDDDVLFTPSKIRCSLPKENEKFPHLAIIPFDAKNGEAQGAYFGDRSIQFSFIEQLPQTIFPILDLP